MLARVAGLLVAGSVPFVVAKCFSSHLSPVNRELPAARVAIIGAGVGGCMTAHFLREMQGGRNLDVHVYSSDGRVGGRADVVELDGHLYESGGSTIHTCNKYLVDAAEKFGLMTLGTKDTPTTPLGIFDGERFVFRLTSCSLCNKFRALFRYGISLVRLNFLVKSTKKKFGNIYGLQSKGQAFRSVPDMLKAMGGEEMVALTQVSAHKHLRQLGYSERLVDELVAIAVRNCYGQNATSVNAFTALIALAGIEEGSLWAVVGGNRLIPQKALESSGATYHPARVESIIRVEHENVLKYTVTCHDHEKEESSDFDVVIIAHPLNTSSVKFKNFSSAIYTPAATTPFQRTIATFIKGEINPSFFNLTTYGKEFPLDIFTTAGTDNSPASFRSVAVDIPSEATKEDVKKFVKPVSEEPLRVWKVFSPCSMTEEDKDQMFFKREKEVEVDWLAYPKYDPPEEFPPFVLDDGMFYINGFEKAASAMEVSAVGGMNVALLARDFLLKRYN